MRPKAFSSEIRGVLRRTVYRPHLTGKGPSTSWPAQTAASGGSEAPAAGSWGDFLARSRGFED
eukprot:6921946-Alexandrium_andersonii.AAC.1